MRKHKRQPEERLLPGCETREGVRTEGRSGLLAECTYPSYSSTRADYTVPAGASQARHRFPSAKICDSWNNVTSNVLSSSRNELLFLAVIEQKAM